MSLQEGMAHWPHEGRCLCKGKGEEAHCGVFARRKDEGASLQPHEGHCGGGPEDGGGAAHHGVVDAAAVDVRDRVVQGNQG